MPDSASEMGCEVEHVCRSRLLDRHVHGAERRQIQRPNLAVDRTLMVFNIKAWDEALGGIMLPCNAVNITDILEIE
jgi:hypothetical protein